MMTKPDSLYFSERLAAELQALETATNDAARRAHKVLADHYQQQLAVSRNQARRASRRVNL